jgi:hypothetical protein
MKAPDASNGLGLLLLASTWLFTAPAVAQEHVGKISQPLTSSAGIKLWTENGNQVPVCWESVGYQREKEIVREAVANTWELFGNVRFTGWNFCPMARDIPFVRIHINPQGTADQGAGGHARHGMAALSTASENNPGVTLSFNPDHSAIRGRIEYVAVHEFGHVLGFIHEQDAPGNEPGVGFCENGRAADPPGAAPVTGYDRDSIMNYCNRDGNKTGNLTDTDIAGVQAIYGVRQRNLPPHNACVSAQFSERVALAAPWNNHGLATIAVFPSDGKKFLYHAQWNVRQGGWGDSVHWASGDFNGDGLSDLAAAWNNGGTAVLTVRTSDGKQFSAAHWDKDAGGWMDSTVWLPGDFNGDGLTDMAAIWNDGGRASIAIYLSDRTRFLYRKQWSVRDGGFADSIKWTAADFNGDGKTDLGAAWNNGGRTTLTVRLSTGSGFTTKHWNLDAGRWSDSSAFVAGDYNADGRADMAEIWNDLSQDSIKVSLSYRDRFAQPRSWATRDGGFIFGDSVKWASGDFNGDGRSDLLAVWNDHGHNVLTVRTSNGQSFAPRHWATNAGGWMDTTAWCAGAFQKSDMLRAATTVRLPRTVKNVHAADGKTNTIERAIGTQLTPMSRAGGAAAARALNPQPLQPGKVKAKSAVVPRGAITQPKDTDGHR